MTSRFSLRSLTVASFALVTLLALPVRLLAAESFYVVEITDMDKKVEHKIMSAEDFKVLETEIRAETSLFPKAEEAAKKEWKSSDEKAAFPGRLNARKAVVLARETVREKADAKLEKLTASEERKNEPKKTTAKPTEAEKKAEAAKAEKEKDLQRAYDLVKGKLDELVAAAKDKDAKPQGDEKPADEKKP
jgi:hypothetical protein